MKYWSAFLIFSSLNASAAIDVSKLTPVSEAEFRVFGKGIQNSETGDNVALVCAHIDSLYGHTLTNPCNAMRFIFFKSGSTTAYYLSDKLIPGSYLLYQQDEGTRAFWGTKSDQVSFDEKSTDALIEHSAQVLITKLSWNSHQSKVASKAVVDRNGWGWSAKPISVSNKYFDDLTLNISFIYISRLPSDHPYAGMVMLNE